jgi:hypothetical protein
LRLDKIVAGRFDIVRGGYEFFHELQAQAPADLYFTSIASDNDRARRFLERGFPGMPRYEFVGEFVTLALSAASAAHCQRPDNFHTSGGADAPPLDAICDFLNHEGGRYELSPCWSVTEVSVLEALGLSKEDFHIARIGERIVGCAALWDQRAFKQTVVRGYVPWLSRLRSAINLVASIARQPKWPAPGTTLAHAFISHLAVTPREPGALTTIITALAAGARRRNIELLTLGFAADDPRLATVRTHFRHREYRSRIYLVHWPDMITEPPQLRADSLAPEAALL